MTALNLEAGGARRPGTPARRDARGPRRRLTGPSSTSAIGPASSTLGRQVRVEQVGETCRGRRGRRAGPTDGWLCGRSQGSVRSRQVTSCTSADRHGGDGSRREGSCSVTCCVGPPCSKKAAALPRPRKLRRTWPQRLLIGFNVFLVGVCLVTAGGIFYTFNRFGDLPGSSSRTCCRPNPRRKRPTRRRTSSSSAPTAARSIDPDDPNIGAFGSESDVGGQRSDTIMVLRIDPASERASILSFPRDLWVDDRGHRKQAAHQHRLLPGSRRAGRDAATELRHPDPALHRGRLRRASRASSTRSAACPCTSRTRRATRTPASTSPSPAA